MSKLIVVAAACAALLAIVPFLRAGRNRAAVPDARASVANASDDAARQEIARLNQSLALALRRIDTLEATAGDVQPTNPKPAPAHEPAEPQNVQANLSRMVATETRDAAWASTSEQQLREAMGETSIRNLSCRSTLCRIELVHKNEQARYGLLQALPARLAAHFAAVHVAPETTQDGETVTVCYVFRKGTQLPAL
jgi:hypothetical protein